MEELREANESQNKVRGTCSSFLWQGCSTQHLHSTAFPSTMMPPPPSPPSGAAHYALSRCCPRLRHLLHRRVPAGQVLSQPLSPPCCDCYCSACKFVPKGRCSGGGGRRNACSGRRMIAASTRGMRADQQRLLFGVGGGSVCASRWKVRGGRKREE